MDEYLIKKLTEEKCIIELHGEDEVIEFRKICEKNKIHTDFMIRSYNCKKIKDQDKIYAKQIYVVAKNGTNYDIVLFYHESYYNIESMYNVIRFNHNSITHTNDLISWIK